MVGALVVEDLAGFVESLSRSLVDFLCEERDDRWRSFFGVSRSRSRSFSTVFDGIVDGSAMTVRRSGGLLEVAQLLRIAACS